MGSEQWVAETRMIAVPPTRVFWEKRLQDIDRSRVRAGGARELPARELRDLGGDEGDHGEG